MPNGSTTALERYVLDGGIMMIFLLPLAFLAVAFIVQGFINLRRNRIVPKSFVEGFSAMAQGIGTRPELVNKLSEEGHTLALVVQRVLKHLEFKPDADPAELLTESIEEECTSLQQLNSQLALVYNIAPLAGLLGTVFGMISTFREFTSSAEPSVQELSAGINVALLTTAWGLAIAIPAFIFLYIFTRKIQRYEVVELPEAGLNILPSLLTFVQRSGADSKSAEEA